MLVVVDVGAAVVVVVVDAAGGIVPIYGALYSLSQNHYRIENDVVRLNWINSESPVNLIYDFVQTCGTTTSTSTTTTTTGAPIVCTEYNIQGDGLCEYEDCDGTPLSFFCETYCSFNICTNGILTYSEGMTATVIGDCSPTSTSTTTTTEAPTTTTEAPPPETVWCDCGAGCSEYLGFECPPGCTPCPTP